MRNTPDVLDANEVAHLERVRADTLGLGDRLPFFGAHVRSVRAGWARS